MPPLTHNLTTRIFSTGATLEECDRKRTLCSLGIFTAETNSLGSEKWFKTYICTQFNNIQRHMEHHYKSGTKMDTGGRIYKNNDQSTSLKSPQSSEKDINKHKVI